MTLLSKMASARSVVLLMILSLAGLTGCASGPAPTLYLLEPVVDEQQPRRPTDGQDVGLSVVKVPGYADDKPIASRVSGTQVSINTDHQWAESPDAAITRLLANRIRAYAGGNVLIEPWPRGFEPQARVEFDFDKLLRNERGGAEVSGQLRLISGDGKNVLEVKNFQVFHESGGLNHQDFFMALSRAINDIARLATVTLQQRATLN